MYLMAVRWREDNSERYLPYERNQTRANDEGAAQVVLVGEVAHQDRRNAATNEGRDGEELSLCRGESQLLHDRRREQLDRVRVTLRTRRKAACLPQWRTRD
jgi:hypothetical protein